MAATADKVILEEIVRDRTMFAERAASLNGIPVHPMRLVHELQTLLRHFVWIWGRSIFGWLDICTSSQADIDDQRPTGA